MRRSAERVDDQMRAYMQTRAIPDPGRPERLLACAVRVTFLSAWSGHARLADRIEW